MSASLQTLTYQTNIMANQPTEKVYKVYQVSKNLCFYEVDDPEYSHMKSFMVNVVKTEERKWFRSSVHPMHVYVDAIELTAEGRNNLWENEKCMYEMERWREARRNR